MLIDKGASWNHNHGVVRILYIINVDLWIVLCCLVQFGLRVAQERNYTEIAKMLMGQGVYVKVILVSYCKITLCCYI